MNSNKTILSKVLVNTGKTGKTEKPQSSEKKTFGDKLQQNNDQNWYERKR